MTDIRCCERALFPAWTGTGKECVNYLLAKGAEVKTLVRSKLTSKGEEVTFRTDGNSMPEEVRHAIGLESFKSDQAGV